MNTEEQKQIDEKSRQYIRENIEENYFVEAGAGSGKTTALVQRMVAIVESGKDISHICAITFTRAAANEFYERFQKELIKRSLDENNPDADKCAAALQNIDLAFMGTIDSFCNLVMSEHPNEGGIPSDSQIVDEEDTERLYKREYARIMNGEYHDSTVEDKIDLFLKYNGYPEEAFVLTLKSLLNHRDCEIVCPAYWTDSVDAMYEDEINDVRKIVRTLCENTGFISSSNDEKAEKLRKAFESKRKTFENSWDDNIFHVLSAYKKTLGSDDLRLRYCDEVTEELDKKGILNCFSIHEGNKKFYEINAEYIPVFIDQIQQNRYAITLDFVNTAKDRILQQLRSEGKLTFGDYLIYLRDTLKKDAAGGGKLIRHIYEKHRYFLIDEFQDTDPIQAEIFFYLSAEKLDEDWKKCVPYKGSLFIVGDPKQSIYRFKNADVASYLNVKKMFTGEVGQCLYLFCNFRSTNQLKDYFNDVFTTLLVDGPEQAAFQPVPVDEKDKRDGFSGVFSYETKSRGIKESDPVIIKDMILKLVHNDKYQIGEKTKDGILVRNLDWNDFMLITPGKGALSYYTKVFREYGIPYYVEGNIRFNESEVFVALVNLYGALTNTNDNRYLYALLKTKLYGITDKQMNEAVKEGYSFNVLNDYQNHRLPDKLYNALKQLKEKAEAASGKKPSELFAQLIEDINLYKKIGNRNLEYVYFALELLKSKEQAKEIIDHNDALQFLEKLLYEKNYLERCPGLKPDGNQVHLANLHKVKGLEAPVVILAYPSSGSHGVDFRMVRSDTGNKGYLFRVAKQLDKASIEIIRTKDYENCYEEEEKNSEAAEKDRLAYVAATRAKNILIIGDSVTSKGHYASNPWHQFFDNESVKEKIETRLASEELTENEVKMIDPDDLAEKTGILSADNGLSTESYSIISPSRLVSDNLPEDMDSDAREQRNEEEYQGDSLATIKGTMVHRLMELTVNSKDGISKDDMIDFIIEENMKDEFSDYEKEFREMLNKVYDTIHNGGFIQRGKAVQDILPVLLNADEVYSEVPFSFEKNGQICNGIIDLLYRKDGRLHIIDWKTNRSECNLDEHYRQQLDAYRLAVRESTGEDVEDALIYHIDIS